jgi:PAS domain S-box-containing protein
MSTLPSDKELGSLRAKARMLEELLSMLPDYEQEAVGSLPRFGDGRAPLEESELQRAEGTFDPAVLDRLRNQFSGSDQSYRVLAETMPQLVWTADAQGQVDYYNQRATEFDGIVATPDGRWKWEPVVHHDDLQNTIAAWTHALQTGATYEIEHRARMRDGSYRWILSRGVPVRDHSGEIVRWFGTATDIHQQKIAQQKFQRLFALSAVGQVELEPSGRFLEVNDRMTDITGYTRDELLSITCTQITHPDDQEEDQRQLQRVLDGEATEYSNEKRYVRKDGVIRWVDVRAALARDEENRPLVLIATIVDVTERREAELEAEESRKSTEALVASQASFLSVLSHEVRTPLTAILGFASLLSENLEGNNKQSASRIEKAAHRLRQTLDTVLTYARLQSGRIELDLTELDVLPVISDAFELFSDEAGRKGLEISLIVEPSVRSTRVLTDEGALAGVLNNLLSNAIKYTERGSVSVRVAADVSMGGILIHVEDTGPGISGDFIGRLFEPFTRQARGHSSSDEGTGLGLAIARELAELIGMTISVTTEEGRGSTFTLNMNVRE